MTRMLMVTDVQDIIKRHQAQIITSLKDPDIRLSFIVFSFHLHLTLMLVGHLRHEFSSVHLFCKGAGLCEDLSLNCYKILLLIHELIGYHYENKFSVSL